MKKTCILATESVVGDPTLIYDFDVTRCGECVSIASHVCVAKFLSKLLRDCFKPLSCDWIGTAEQVLGHK